MAPPKVILQLYPMMPAAGEEDRKRRRPLGRNRDAYHRALHDWIDIIRAAEDLGVWGASTIEHHLHSEGYEVGPNPGILNAWWASRAATSRAGPTRSGSSPKPGRRFRTAAATTSATARSSRNA